ncbi:MAG: hypothetical protein WCV67_04185 [Victivallaceae bacterium]|jgi:hypothetical protein
MIIFAWKPVKNELQKYAGVLFCLITRQWPLRRPDFVINGLTVFRGIGNKKRLKACSDSNFKTLSGLITAK